MFPVSVWGICGTRYVQVADAIEAGIQAGDFLPDRPILSENQLVWKYGIARGAARKSIQLLRERRLVVTVVGGE